MKGVLAWIIFLSAAVVCLLWIGFGVRDDLREDAVFNDVIQARIDQAESSDGEVHIGVAGDWREHGDILRGVQLAAEEINEGGGILGCKIVLEPRDDHGTVEGALTVAQEFVSRPEISFVIGHTDLPLVVSVAQNYEFYGVLALSPNTSGMGATAHTFSLLFENGMPPAQTGEAILALAREKGWERIGLIYAKSDQATRQARQFESLANRHGIRVPLSFGYEGRGSGVSLHMERWKRELDLDAMVLTVRDADEIPLISACRVVGIGCPFIVSGEKPAGVKPGGDAALGTLYFLESARLADGYTLFSRNYAARFKTPPTADAVMGYDALHLYATAVREAGTFVPADVAASLRGEVAHSLTCTMRFDDHGSAVKRVPRFVEP